jgi:glyoxylase-like metal-dependent hydrolase (beta-lactamase superfamily II)
MKAWKKILIGFVAIMGAAGYWLLFDNRPGETIAPLDLAALSAAAEAVPGEKAASISVERAASGSLPGTLLVAGGGFGNVNQGVHAFRVDFKEAPLLIDTGFDETAAKTMSFYKRDAAKQARIDAVMAQAGIIVVTHEHADHLGALLSHPKWDSIKSRALITKGQFDHPEATAPGQWPKGSRTQFRSHVYEGVKAIAPGVAVMQAPSHTPGSQIIYVKLSNGREYLFMGDIASMDSNWRDTRARSRLIGDFVVDEDRAAVFAWLRAFKKASEANPRLIMVPTHDADAIDRLTREGALREGF